MAIVFQVVIHGHRVEVGCYGAGTDWACRLTDPSAQPGHAADDFYPAPDLGFAWFREVAGFWSASALVNQGVFRDAETVRRLLKRVSRRLLGHDEQLVSCVEFVAAKSTATWDGELGTREARGGWAEDRWWQRKPARRTGRAARAGPAPRAAGWRITLLDSTRYDRRNRAVHHPVPDPTWEQVRDAVRALDGGRRSDLSIEAADGNLMCVGGGRGRYTVATQTGRQSRNGVAANLLNPAGGDAVEGGVVVGGCQTDIPERYVVALEAVLQAAERFFRDGALDPALAWEPY